MCRQVDVTAKNRLKKLRKDRQEVDLAGPEFEQRLRSRYFIFSLGFPDVVVVVVIIVSVFYRFFRFS